MNDGAGEQDHSVGADDDERSRRQRLSGLGRVRSHRTLPVTVAVAVAVAVALLGGCDNPAPLPPDDFVDAVPLLATPDVARQAAHAHNDYEHPRPLLDALDQHFTSVEVDVFWRDGQIAVAHYPWQFRGELAPLYLDPLVALVEARGSVYGEGTPLTLWIDLKDDSDALTDAIHDQLARSPHVFTRYLGDDEIEVRPVRVVLTGAAAKTRYAERDERFAIRDSNTLDANDPTANARWGYYAVSYDAVVSEGDDGFGILAERAHANDRLIRVYGAPDDEDTWCAQREAAIDFIGTDRLADLGAFLDDAEAQCSPR